MSGLWAACAGSDSVPTLPTDPPIAPVKPRSDSIMAHYKESIRQRLLGNSSRLKHTSLKELATQSMPFPCPVTMMSG